MPEAPEHKGKPGTAGHSAIRDELTVGTSVIVITAQELGELTCSSDLSELLTQASLYMATREMMARQSLAITLE